jgi:hypothetical protein
VCKLAASFFANLPHDGFTIERGLDVWLFHFTPLVGALLEWW